MWVMERITSLLGVLFCAQTLALAGLQPSWVGRNTAVDADQAYYDTTAVLEQETASLRLRGDDGTVPQWGCFEKAVPNAQTYDNPYEDVVLEVKFTKPDGSVLALWGFYDGENTWRIRVMPDQTGAWQYEAHFSDGAGHTSGSFVCVAHDIPGQISAYAKNPLWFGFKGGKAVLVRSFQVGDKFLADANNPLTGQSWSCAQRELFLDWAQRQGYNMLSIASCYLNQDSSGHGRGWNTPALWDAARQQPDWYQYRRLEQVLDELAERGILVYPLGGFFGRDSDFPKDPAKEEVYVRYTLTRLGCYWNMLLNVGGPEPLSRGASFLTAEQINEWGRKIQSLNVCESLLSVSNAPGDDPFKDAPWASYSVLGGPRTTDLKRLGRLVLRNHDKAKPLYACETLWAGSNRSPQYTLQELRKSAYVLIMSGGAINFADLNGDFSSGLSGTLDLKQKVQPRHDVLKKVWDYFESTPFWRLKPRQDLVSVSGDSADSMAACLAEPGQRYLVYLNRSATVTVKIDEGTYQVAWINASDPKDVRKSGIIEGRRALTSPYEQDDWLLSLVRVELIGGEFRER
jgi:hypothetical protein